MTFKYEPCAIGTKPSVLKSLNVTALARDALLGRPQHHAQSKFPATVANGVAASSGGSLMKGHKPTGCIHNPLVHTTHI